MRKLANDPIKRVVQIGGVLLSIEWPKGSTRTWKNSDFKRKMFSDYGYIRGSEGADGEELDVYVNTDIGLNTTPEKVYEIEQTKKDTGEFDEHKYMVGFNSSSESADCFLKHMDPGNFGGINEMTWDEFLNLVPESAKIQKTAELGKQQRAMLVELTELPKEMKDGTNCGNCMFVKLPEQMCEHPLVNQKVSPEMCCVHWQNPKAKLVKV